MCGIGGYFGHAASGTMLPTLVSGLAHRGPDGHGCWEDPSGGAGLAHTRLAILGLGPGGAQPMSSADGRYHLVFNGEIYNHRELRNALVREGHVFRGNSDTEVLLTLLCAQGASAVSRLAGMFAFAFYDSHEKTGLLARDPFGIKPLYYSQQDGSLTFCSELRTLRQMVRQGGQIHPEAVRDFLLWGSVPEPETLISGCHMLPAGSLLTWRGSVGRTEQWFRLMADDSALPDQQCMERTREALRESLTRHLESDVPVGVFLSGGIDSTAIAVLTREILGTEATIQTFSIGFEESEFDESGLAQRTAKLLGTQHETWLMTAAQGAEEIDGYLHAMDQPTIDGFNTWCVSRLARRNGVKVVLSGLGGDEVFGGYGSFRRLPQLRQLRLRAGACGPVMARLTERLTQGTRWARLADSLSRPATWKSAYHVQRGIFTEREARILTESICGRDPGKADWADAANLPQSPGDIVSWLELSRYMRNQLLRDSDVFSMAQGLELRVPFVDQRFVQTQWTIPASRRLRGHKSLLTDAVPEIPEWIRDQPKRGFRFPFQSWLEQGFQEILQEADRRSPVRLSTWYRKWAVAALLHSLRSLGLTS